MTAGECQESGLPVGDGDLHHRLGVGRTHHGHAPHLRVGFLRVQLLGRLLSRLGGDEHLWRKKINHSVKVVTE